MKHPGISVFLSLTGATILSAAFLAAPAFADTYLELLSATKQQALALSEEEAGEMAEEALSYYTREEINNSIHLEADGSGMLSSDGAAVPVLFEDGYLYFVIGGQPCILQGNRMITGIEEGSLDWKVYYKISDEEAAGLPPPWQNPASQKNRLSRFLWITPGKKKPCWGLSVRC